MIRAVVWVIDDLEANHALVRRSMPAGHEEACVLVSYLTGEDALADMHAAFDGDSSALPDVVFMDFFLGSLYGHEVTEKVRGAFAARKLQGPYIVGHSSSPPASLAIVRAGGDVAIEKDRHAPVSRGVRQLFPDCKALLGYAGRALKPA